MNLEASFPVQLLFWGRNTLRRRKAGYWCFFKWAAFTPEAVWSWAPVCWDSFGCYLNCVVASNQAVEMACCFLAQSWISFFNKIQEVAHGSGIVHSEPSLFMCEQAEGHVAHVGHMLVEGRRCGQW